MNYHKGVATRLENAALHNSGRIHIISQNGRWAVWKEGAQRASRVFDTRDEAINAARLLQKSANHKTIVVHNIDGSIRKVFTK